MTALGNAEEHVQLQLGLYVLGALPPEEHSAVEEHLRGCAECSADCAELDDVMPFLAIFSRDEAEELVKSGTVGGMTAEPEPPRVPAPGRKAGTPVRPGSRSDPTTRPATRVSASARSSGSPWRLRYALYAVAVALVVGVVAGVWLRSATAPVGITLAGTETNSVTGVRMSVTVVGQAGGTAHTTAEISGLRPDVAYELYAVTVGGQTQVVSRWVADTRPYAFAGDVGLDTDELAFFAVATEDGVPAVTVRMARPDD